MIDLKVFPAFKGDSFLLTWGSQDEKFSLLIDAGIVGTYMFISQAVAKIDKLDGLIITHVDFDHIGGFTLLVNDSDTKITQETTIFMNSPSLYLTSKNSDKVNLRHGIEFSELLKQKKLLAKKMHLDLYVDNRRNFNGLDLLILSPPRFVLDKFESAWTAESLFQTYLDDENKLSNKVSKRNLELKSIQQILDEKEETHSWETDLINSSSIAFLCSFNDRRILFLGDANPTLVSAEFEKIGFTEANPLIVDLVKLSHHGSKNNTTSDLLKRIKCNSYLISTNGAGPYYHPDRETIIRLSEFGRESRNDELKIYTNYELDLEGLITAKELELLNITISVCTDFNFETSL